MIFFKVCTYFVRVIFCVCILILMHSIPLQPANSIFLLCQISISHQHQSVSSIFLSQQTSTNHQPQPAEQSGRAFEKLSKKNFRITFQVISFSENKKWKSFSGDVFLKNSSNRFSKKTSSNKFCVSFFKKFSKEILE